MTCASFSTLAGSTFSVKLLAMRPTQRVRQQYQLMDRPVAGITVRRLVMGLKALRAEYGAPGHSNDAAAAQPKRSGATGPLVQGNSAGRGATQSAVATRASRLDAGRAWQPELGGGESRTVETAATRRRASNRNPLAAVNGLPITSALDTH